MHILFSYNRKCKSLMSEGFRELKWACPLCSLWNKTVELTHPKQKTDGQVCRNKSQIGMYRKK